MKIFKTKKYSILANILKYSFVFMFGLALLGNVAFAVCPGDPGCPPAELDNTTDPAELDNTVGGITTTIKNPLGDNGPKDIPAFIEKIIDIVLIVGVPIVTLAIIYTGFLFVEAQGNPEKLTKARKALMYTLIGAALILGAWVIAKAIGTTVDDIKSTT
jgi:hypothetical protein